MSEDTLKKTFGLSMADLMSKSVALNKRLAESAGVEIDEEPLEEQSPKAVHVPNQDQTRSEIKDQPGKGVAPGGHDGQYDEADGEDADVDNPEQYGDYEGLADREDDNPAYESRDLIDDYVQQWHEARSEESLDESGMYMGMSTKYMGRRGMGSQHRGSQWAGKEADVYMDDEEDEMMGGRRREVEPVDDYMDDEDDYMDDDYMDDDYMEDEYMEGDPLDEESYAARRRKRQRAKRKKKASTSPAERRKEKRDRKRRYRKNKAKEKRRGKKYRRSARGKRTSKERRRYKKRSKSMGEGRDFGRDEALDEAAPPRFDSRPRSNAVQVKPMGKSVSDLRHSYRLASRVARVTEDEDVLESLEMFMEHCRDLVEEAEEGRFTDEMLESLSNEALSIAVQAASYV